MSVHGLQKELETIRAALDTYANAHSELLAKSPDISIVFLSTSVEYAVTAFALNATHYLLKPFSQEQFNEALDRAVKKAADQDFLSLACVDGMYRVCATEIVSIESQNHYLLLNLSSGEILKLRMKLSQMFEELLNGVKISIPRRSSEEVQKTYMDFCRKVALK